MFHTYIEKTKIINGVEQNYRFAKFINDHVWATDIICPHCYFVHWDRDELADDLENVISCDYCNKKFFADAHILLIYSTKKLKKERKKDKGETYD